jgi:hypothetical protein
MGRTKYLLLAGLFSIGAVGCGEGTTPPPNNNTDGGPGADASPESNPNAPPVDQPNTATRSAQYAGDVVRQVGGVLGFVTADNSVVSRLTRLVESEDEEEPDDPPLAPLPAPLPAPILSRIFDAPSFKALRPRPSFLKLATMEENLDSAASDIEDFFKTRLFVQANVESSTSSSITYLLKPDPTCRPLPSEIAEGETDRVGLECAGDLAKLQVRIVVTSDGDGYRFQILLGPDKHELSVIIIHSDELAWEADLNKARLATQFANMALDSEEGDGDEFPFAMLKGRIKVALKKLGEKKVSLSWSVLEAIEIQDMDRRSFAMAPASPVFTMTGDGVAKTLALQLAIPQTDVRMPWDPKEIDAPNSDLHISIGGLHGMSTLSETAEELAFQGLGVGASFVEVRNIKIFELGFNAANGHKMDLKIKPIAGDQARFEITPKLDLSLAFALQMVAAEFNADDQPEPWMLGQTLSVLMAGGSRVVAETVQESETFEGGVKMVEGSLTLSTSADSNATVTVPMGQCLTENPMPAEASHELLGELMSAACPAAPAP